MYSCRYFLLEKYCFIYFFITFVMKKRITTSVMMNTTCIVFLVNQLSIRFAIDENGTKTKYEVR